MIPKQSKEEKKYTVQEVLKSLQWSVEGGKLQILSSITDEYITIELNAIISKSDEAEQD